MKKKLFITRSFSRSQIQTAFIKLDLALLPLVTSTVEIKADSRGKEERSPFEHLLARYGNP